MKHPICMIYYTIIHYYYYAEHARVCEYVTFVDHICAHSIHSLSIHLCHHLSYYCWLDLLSLVRALSFSAHSIPTSLDWPSSLVIIILVLFKVTLLLFFVVWRFYFYFVFVFKEIDLKHSYFISFSLNIFCLSVCVSLVCTNCSSKVSPQPSISLFTLLLFLSPSVPLSEF